MRRTIRSSRTRKNVIATSALRDQFIRQLASEADALLKQALEQFNQTIQTQAAQAVRGIVAGDTAPGIGTDGSQPGTIGSIGQLLATGARYLVSRPRTARDTVETSRSIDANTSFRLSQSQASIEASAALDRGGKNA